jgi:hypothetical protein
MTFQVSLKIEDVKLLRVRLTSFAMETQHYVPFLVGVLVAVNNIKEFSVAMEIQKWVIFALFSNFYKFRTVVRNKCSIL